MINTLLYWLEPLAVAVFALTGAIVAARQKMDPIGFVILAIATGIGGGTLRDAILAKPAFWLSDSVDVLCCITVALVSFWRRAAFLLTENRAPRYQILPWADAVGLSLFAIAGAERALTANANALAAIMLGAITASFGGIIRDVVIGRKTLIVKREIYLTAAVVAATVYVGVVRLTDNRVLPTALGFFAGFGLRACALIFEWRLPRYRSGPRDR